MVSNGKEHHNAFDLLRIMLAFFVIISHSYLVGGYKADEPLSALSKGQTNFSEIGVMGFFTLSGYLITASFERTKNLVQFLIHRALRIFPGFWACLLITAFVFAPIIFGLNGGYFSAYVFTGHNGSASYVFDNFWLIIRQWSIKDVLASAPYKYSLNGSLWSLYPEMQCYLFTMLAGYFNLFNKNRLLYLFIFIMASVYFAINFCFNIKYGPTIITLSPAFKLYVSFIAGSILFVFKDRFILDFKGTLFSVFVAIVLLRFGGFNIISPLLIAIVLINVFKLFTFKARYDVSYGLYIYSFPTQQLLFVVIGEKLPVFLFILITFLTAGLLGLLSYKLIEKPAINFRKKLVKITSRFQGIGYNAPAGN